MSASSNNERIARDAWIRALQRTAEIGRDPHLTLPKLIERQAAATPQAPALIGENETLSYRALAERSLGYAGWASREGVGVGDVVCLMMPNCPEYMAIWLGLVSVGAVVALLNTNLAGDRLAHAIDSVAPKGIIASTGLGAAVAEVLPSLRATPSLWLDSNDPLREPDRHSGAPVIPTLGDRALCIYTSGTTGLPKAANVSHRRIMQWSLWFAGLMDAQSQDRMYNCLPMYHSVGGVVATGAMLASGGSVVIRERFSASQFWGDVAANKCTVFQYIGELCRYLVNTPPQPRETGHSLRLACGNGLRGDIWREFQTRFRIPRILEFYAATEANFSLYNCEGEPGSIGHIPPFLTHRLPIALVRFNPATEMPVRGPDGLCIPCAPGEAGEAISRISDDSAGRGTPFEGYTDAAASERKVLGDVFASGDAWFRSGDLMRRDARGFFYFVDRIGDTFRWKGENVSTTEVAEAITACPGVTEAVVYGVAVPGAEGRAGMATIVTRPGFDLAVLHRHLHQELPGYARPLFLRIRSAIELTETFKQKKQELQRQGFDPHVHDEPIYFDDPAAQAFVPVDDALYTRIVNGQMRL